jgi:hypothetical protein
MADKYTKKQEGSPADTGDRWKDAVVEKEYQPPKAKIEISYRQLENELAQIEARTKANADRKAEIEAEMAKVKTVAEAK